MATKKKNARKEQPWELAGEVGVDSGQLLIADPCYLDSEWEQRVDPDIQYPVMVLTDKGKEKFPGLEFRFNFPFPWGTYASVCPALGMDINEAVSKGLVQEEPIDPKDIYRGFNYKGACAVSDGEGDGFGQLNYKLGHPGAGVAVSSGYGDGVYPVLVQRNSEGRIAKVLVVLIDDEDEED